MTRRRSAAAIVLALLLIGPALGISATASASSRVPTRAQSAVPRGVLAVLAVRAANYHVFANSDTGHSRWADLGGRVLSTPAVAYSAQTETTYYVGIGTDRQLWVRTGKQSWRHLVDPSIYNSCRYAPAVELSGSTFAVACTGSGSGRTYVGTTTLPADGSVPILRALHNQGGYSLSGPTLLTAGSHLELAVLSTANSIGNVYLHFLSEPAGRFHRAGVYCSARAGIANDSTYLGCQNGNPGKYGGTTDSMFFRTRDAAGVTGTMSGAVGVAANYSASQGAFFVTDLHGAVWAKNVTPTSQAGWHRLGGQALPGVSAAPLG